VILLLIGLRSLGKNSREDMELYCLERAAGACCMFVCILWNYGFLQAWVLAGVIGCTTRQ